MECNYWCSALCSILPLLLASLLLRRRFRNGSHRRPPGPPGWPVVGNMFDLGALPHQTLMELRSMYGPVLWLRLGSVNTMVVQSDKTAAELFKNHDKPFSDRTCPLVFTAHDYHLGSLAFGSQGPYWRAVRRVVHAELLPSRRVSGSAASRQRCVDDMLRRVAEDSAAQGGPVEIGPHVFVMLFNVIGNMMLSRDVVDRSEKGREFLEAMVNVFEWAGTPNVGEYLPWLAWMDPQGLMRKMRRDLGKVRDIVAGFVRERKEEGERKDDFLDALLNYEGDGSLVKFSDNQVIIIILEVFFAGTETTGGSLDWAMSELMKHPEAMKKAQEELDRVVGRERKVSESDVDQLPYLQAVLKESMRLHPMVPFLVPRSTMEDTKFMGYTIPKSTQVFVNVWAIGRDPDAWDDPLTFKPERFLGSDIEFKGKNYEFIPFGAGRRMCAGIALAHKVMQLAMASLLQSFDWELGSHVSPETLDMSDKLGFTVRRYVPLKVIPKKRM